MPTTKTHTDHASSHATASEAHQGASDTLSGSHAFESGTEAVCELGNALAHLRTLERTRNDLLSGERAGQHREAIERAILDLAVGMGAQRDAVCLSYEPREFA